ncbi:hypothetical protein [Flavobacterium ginsenosidimutans]|uniref:Lipoprotein n=1 Tax=Flavobacterium ginsenosidimutans TaxID=687844 RepID=A0ABZ2QGT2_9FLAO
MKNIILFILAINILTACKNKKETNAQQLEVSVVRKSNEDSTAINNENSPKQIEKELIKDCLPLLIDDPKLEKEKVIFFDSRKWGGEYWVDKSKNELNKIEALFPALTDKSVPSPLAAYTVSYLPKKYINQDGVVKQLDFKEPLGQDEFYLLYAYYLKQKNGDSKYKVQRDKLVDLYNAINEIYVSWSQSLLYYDHQGFRIYACAEYSIFLLDQYKEDFDSDFIEQKKLYLKSLKQYAQDQFKGSKIYDGNRIKENIAILEKLITNYYYLEQVRTFEIEYYRSRTIYL